MDTPLLATLPALPKALVVYLGKSCEADGFVPLREGDRASSLRFRLGGEPNETPVIDRCLELAVETRNVTLRDGGIVLTEFAAWQRRTKEPWVRLFVREELEFMRLPLLARAVAALLLKVCDDRGVIGASADDLAVWMGRAGKTRGERCNDRRVVRRALAALLEDGYLQEAGAGLVIPNFIAAQSPVGGAPADRRQRAAVAASMEHQRSADDAEAERKRAAVAASMEHQRSADDAEAERKRAAVAAPTEHQRSTDEGVSARNHSDGSLPSTVCTSSIQSIQSPPPAGLDGGEFKLVSPTPADLAPKSKAKARARAKAPPSIIQDVVPEEGTVAHNLYTAIVTDPKLRPIVRNPGEFCLKIVQAYGHIPGERLVGKVHSAGLYLVTSQPYSDGNAFLRNQFERLADSFAREPRPAEAGSLTSIASARAIGPAGRAVAAG